MTKLLSPFRRVHPDIEALSASVDAGPDSRANSALAAHLASCAECGRRFQELRDVRAALRSMPSADVPRSFRLRRADVETAAARRSPSSATGVLRLMPAMSALAFVLFAALVGADLLSSRESGSASLTTGRLANAPKAAAPKAEAPSPGSPAAASKAEAGPSSFAETATAGSLASAPAAGDAAVPATSDGALAPSAADTVPSPNSSTPGTFAGAPPSYTVTAPADAAAQAAQRPPTPESRDNNVTPGAASDPWSRLRIAEVIVIALAIVSGAITVVRWAKNMEA
ncbi:MAG: hypothetical protein M3P30_01570 [Chloroflexota bacterium]|nr:hypothetical protein [Chloroflexota bacterium]